MNKGQFLIQKNINLYKHCSDDVIFAHKRTLDESKNYPLHLNRYYEIYILAEGCVDYIVEGSCFKLSYGDIVIISPYEVHKPCVDNLTWYERFYFLVPTNAFDYMTKSPIKALAEIHKSVGNLITPPPEEKKKILHLLNAISDNNGNDELSMALANYATFINILSIINLCRTPADDSEKITLTNDVPRLVSDVLIYIDNNLTFIGSINEIAEHFNISIPYLSSLFKKKLNVNISEYICTRKIGYAKKLLDKGGDLTSVCFDSGFNDCSYFAKVFKSCVGMTPRQYKHRK